MPSISADLKATFGGHIADMAAELAAAEVFDPSELQAEIDALRAHNDDLVAQLGEAHETIAALQAKIDAARAALA